MLSTAQLLVNELHGNKDTHNFLLSQERTEFRAGDLLAMRGRVSAPDRNGLVVTAIRPLLDQVDRWEVMTATRAANGRKLSVETKNLTVFDRGGRLFAT